MLKHMHYLLRQAGRAYCWAGQASHWSPKKKLCVRRIGQIIANMKTKRFLLVIRHGRNNNAHYFPSPLHRPFTAEEIQARREGKLNRPFSPSDVEAIIEGKYHPGSETANHPANQSADYNAGHPANQIAGHNAGHNAGHPAAPRLGDLNSNKEYPSAKARPQEITAPHFETIAPGLAQAWLFFVESARRPNKDDHLDASTKFFAELLRHGVAGETILAEINDPRRLRAEYLHELRDRILPKQLANRGQATGGFHASKRGRPLDG